MAKVPTVSAESLAEGDAAPTEKRWKAKRFFQHGAITVEAGASVNRAFEEAGFTLDEGTVAHLRDIAGVIEAA